TDVIARLPASGRRGVLIGAHGDHLGLGEVSSSLADVRERNLPHIGADDNASGVAGVLELAHFFAELRRKAPARIRQDIYFAIWSAEELGVLGSSYFAETWRHPSQKKFNEFFTAALNMDMIGRLRERLLVQGVGSGPEWRTLAEKIALKHNIPLGLMDDPFAPTDSMAFYVAGIPSINFFTGSHAEYHTPRDTEELINYPGLVDTIKVVAAFTGDLVSSEKAKVTWQKVESSRKPLEGRSFRIYLGTIPDYSQDGVKGVRISGVSKNSPAEKAGLQAKDVIVELAGTTIENIYDYVYTLQSMEPDKDTLIKVRRSDRIVELNIVPKLKE
ncbi:MAG: M28 family peptidase, partial [Bdellovibrionaceae bacterium]|nr:M28 family peptidase [Pseudobdellovibrionaceae bacterium]